MSFRKFTARSFPDRSRAAIKCTWLVVVCLMSGSAMADELNRLPLLTFQKIADTDAQIKVDGRLDESVWADLPVYDNMRLIDPGTLAEVPYATEIRFFYSERGLYVGIHAKQPKDTLVARLSSRDQRISRDGVSITLDPSGEGLYGYWFAVYLGNSVGDGTVLPERQFSSRWDGAWKGASATLEDGYSVEYFLPWSMMTMPEVDGDKRQMGFYTSRVVSHKGEVWGWPSLPFHSSQFMSALQQFEVESFEPKKQFTFYPYASSTYNVIDSEDDYKAGFDIFWRPSSNMQLTATVNPDFGNVESDDVIVNLSSTETFFPEKRPFFLEGQEIFSTTPRAQPRGFNATPLVLVHTRRIGSPPRELDVDGLNTTRLEENQPSELVGAAKITGQNGQWRYGVFAAQEDDTKIEGTINGLEVDLQQDGRNFGAARFLYESTDGNSRKGLGWITTMVNHPDQDAVVHGVDGHYLSDGGTWNVDGQLLYSDVADVTGAGGFVDLTYRPDQDTRHSLALDYFDEDLEINDFGFLRRNDSISARYKYTVVQNDLPNLKMRESSFTVAQEYNTDGRSVRSGIFFQQERLFKNNSFLYSEFSYHPSRWDDLNSYDNGDFRINPRYKLGSFWASDDAKEFQLGLGYFFREEDIGGQQNFYEMEVNWRPSDRFSAKLYMVYRTRSDWLLWEDDRDFTTFEAEFWQPQIELNYFLTAKQQLRLTAQWVGIKAHERDRWQIPLGDGNLMRDTSPATDPRDFSISELVFQARYRWEIAPLSDLFVVYTRGSDLPNRPGDGFTDLLRDSWTDRAVDVFVIKLRYRLGN